MKTITELSGSLVRAAAAAIEEAKRSLPAEQPAPPPHVEAAPVEAAPVDAAPADAVPADAAAEPQSVPEEAAPEQAAAEQPAAEPPAQAPAEGAGREVPPALLEAAAKATGLSGDRLAMLCSAVEAAGGRVQDVRLVRVFGSEEPVSGAKTIRGHQYLVDILPQSMKQVASTREEGGRRGGRGRGGGGRGGGGGGRGGGEKGTGGFSMDSLREDRKNQRGGPGRPGGFRKPGGGGRPPGGAPRGR